MRGLAPWITPEQVEERRRYLPKPVFRRLWEDGGQWVDAEGGDALAEDEITRSIVLAGPMRERAFGWRFLAGLDIGTRRDFTGLVLVAKHVGGCKRRIDGGEPEVTSRLGKILADINPLRPSGWPSFRRELTAKYEEEEPTGRLRLANVALWKPIAGQVDLGDVERTILAWHQQYGIATLACDPWQAEYILQRLRRAGIRVDGVDFTGRALQTMATETLSVFRESKLELYDHPQLVTDLKDLRVRGTAVRVQARIAPKQERRARRLGDGPGVGPAGGEATAVRRRHGEAAGGVLARRQRRNKLASSAESVGGFCPECSERHGFSCVLHGFRGQEK